MKLFGIFLDFSGFLGGIFWIFLGFFLGGIFWVDFFGRILLGGFVSGGIFFGGYFWEEFFVYIVKVS